MPTSTDPSPPPPIVASDGTAAAAAVAPSGYQHGNNGGANSNSNNNNNNNNNNIAAVSSLAMAATARSNIAPSQPQPEMIIDDDITGPEDPPSAAIILEEEALDASASGGGNKNKRAATFRFRPELILDDSAGPAPPAGDVLMAEETHDDGTHKKTAAASASSIIREQASGAGAGGVRLELMEDHDGPPPNYSDADYSRDGTMADKKMRAKRSEGAMVPSREEIQDEGAIETVRSGGIGGSGPVDTDIFVDELEQQLGMQEGAEGDANTTNAIVARSNAAAPTALTAVQPAEETILTAMVEPAALPHDDYDGNPPELEAYPVDDYLVIPEPILPLWKQKRVRLLACLVVAIVVALGIALGVAARSSPSNPGTVTGAMTITSSSPTTFPSLMPSLSAAPSSSPTSCAYTISSNAKKIGFRFVNAQQNPRVAVDGNNMVVGVRDFKSSTFYTIFYALESNGEWIMRNSFSRANDGLVFSLVALSGTTAFVSVFTLADGTVSVYEQNDFGFWEEVVEPFVDARFWSIGAYAGVGPEVACVGDFLGGNMYLFRRDGNDRWVQRAQVFRGIGCSVAGNTIGVAVYLTDDHLIDVVQQNDPDRTIDAFFQLYEYDEDGDEFVLLQDPIPASPNGGALSRDHAVYSDWKERDVSIYHRGKSNETYTFLQRLDDVSPPGDMLAVSTVALDGNILVVRGDNRTHIFYSRSKVPTGKK